jgi:hypothetical protein
LFETLQACYLHEALPKFMNLIPERFEDSDTKLAAKTCVRDDSTKISVWQKLKRD